MNQVGPSGFRFTRDEAKWVTRQVVQSLSNRVEGKFYSLGKLAEFGFTKGAKGELSIK